MKVFKFKGAMLADAAALSDIKNKLNKEQESSVVVVSALKGVMPQLRSLYSQALQKGQGFEEEFKALKDKHLQMAEKLLSGQKKKEYLEALQFHLNELYDTLNQVAVLKDVSHSLKDYVLSKGDILSSLLFCALFDKANWHDSRNFIITNNNFGAPEIQWEESCRAAKKEFKEAIEDSPIIAAIKDDEGLKKCLTSESRVIFILYGDICNIPDIVETVKSSGKIAMVHIDLIAGLSSKEIAVDFIQKYTKADGIITTKPALIKRAKELGLYTILRLFVIDSMAYSNIEHQLRTAKPDLIEVLPALMPKVLAKVCKLSTVPVIAGGLVSDKEDVMALLQAGVVSISSTNEKIWFL